MIWRRYHRAGVPEYLARHYWWAYLARPMVWFFDHQPIINLILFGQYRELMQRTVARFRRGGSGERVLQLTNVYGELTPTLVDCLDGRQFHLMDIAQVQLDAARRKLHRAERRGGESFLARMNAEKLAYADDSFDMVMIFFLLHELPPDARRRVLSEALRVLKPGGRLLTTDYGALTAAHFLQRFPLTRWIIGRLEPFLPAFWQEDLRALISEAARGLHKAVAHAEEESIFAGFYRVAEFRMQIDVERYAARPRREVEPLGEALMEPG